MKITLNPNRRQQGVILWVLIILLVIFIVVIGGITYMMIKAIKKLVPPQKDPDGSLHYPAPGSSYQGGIVVGYWPGSSQFDYLPLPTNQPVGSFSMLIYAGDCATNIGTTNCIYATNWASYDEMTNALNDMTVSNVIQLDPETNLPCRFYQPVIEAW